MGVRGLSVRCDTENSVLVMGFLVERGVHADVVGVAAGVVWDESLPVEVKELPEDLAALDVLLSDPELLWPLVERWQRRSRRLAGW